MEVKGGDVGRERGRKVGNIKKKEEKKYRAECQGEEECYREELLKGRKKGR